MPPAKKKGPPPKAKKAQAQTSTPSLIQSVGDAMASGDDGSGTMMALFGAAPIGPAKKEEPFDRRKEIDLLTQQVNSQFKGRVMIREGKDITNVFMLRRPTGVVNLDIACGGGLPAGGLTQIIGKYSAGKSYLVNRIFAEAQRNYGHDFAGAACMTEQRFDKNFSKWKCGLRIALSNDEIAVLEHINRENGRPPFTTEQLAWLQDQVGTFTECVGATAEQLLETACQQIESNLFQVLLIDSFGALLTKAEAEAEEGLEQKHRGGAAMVITQFMHRLHAALNLPDKYGRPNTTTVVGINQYRDNVNAGAYGNPMKVAGGNSLAHGKLLDIHVEQGAKIRIPYGKDQVIVGKEIHWEILKAKAGAHDGPKGTYKFYFGENGYGFGIDIYEDLLVAGLKTSVVQQSGAWYSYNGERLGQGAANVAMTFHQNPDILQAVRKDIFKVGGLNFIIKENV